MAHGEVAEYDTPLALLLNQQSLFRSMCELSGDFAAIHDIATAASHRAV